MGHRIYWTLLILLTVFTLNSHATDSPYAPAVAEKIQALGYPTLPLDTANSIAHRTRRPNSVPSNSIARSNQWALACIGFFSIFNPILLPIDPRMSPCTQSVVVAVVDTGIDYTHPDLVNSLWVNQTEMGPWSPPPGMVTTCRNKNCNGIDDDANGYIDDVMGWDFVHNIPTPYDTLGHGTHIAGIITSSGETGPIGVCAGVSIMALKYYDPMGPGSNNLTNLVRAIHYANTNGADIINFSGGGVTPSELELKALTASREMGVLVVTAAGNQGRNNDLFGAYPANYPLENILSVAAVDSKNALVAHSNFGARVHLAAPGLGIPGLAPQGGTTSLTGTSQATAFVSGAAALLMSQIQRPSDRRYGPIKSWLTRGSKPLNFERQNVKLGHGLLWLPSAYQLLRNEYRPQP